MVKLNKKHYLFKTKLRSKKIKEADQIQIKGEFDV